MSFLCSILEAVILSVSPNYIESLKHKDPRLYKKLNPMRKNIEKPLASILTINTFAHTIGAAGAGAQAQEVFGSQWIGVFSFVLTLLILFLSEIIPKSIGATYWKNLLKFSAKILPIMIITTYPLVYISELLSKLFDKTEDKTSREEITAIVDIGFKEGTLKEKEHQILSNSLSFKDKKATNIITLAEDVVGINNNLKGQELLLAIAQISYSRIPVFGFNRDDVKGYILKNDILSQFAQNKKIEIQSVYKPMLIVTDETTIEEVFRRVIERKEHICSVIDKEGRFLGIITLENILEELLGFDIIDEFDQSEE